MSWGKKSQKRNRLEKKTGKGIKREKKLEEKVKKLGKEKVSGKA